MTNKTIGVGSRVKLKLEGQIMTLLIDDPLVCKEECISPYSPAGISLIGKTAGEVVSYTILDKEIKLEIREVA